MECQAEGREGGMTFVRSSSASITTSTGGASTDYTTDVMNGQVWAIKAVVTGTTSTADIVVTGETSAVPILTKANNASAFSSRSSGTRRIESSSTP